MKIKIPNSIILFFKETFDVDVSNKEIAYGKVVSNNLGEYSTIFDTITIKEGLSGIKLESTIVHELMHHVQHSYNKSFTIDIEKDEPLYYYVLENGEELYTIHDLSIDEKELMIERFGYHDYWNERVEIDARIGQVAYEYYMSNNKDAIHLYAYHIFMSGLTPYLKTAINNLKDSVVKEVLIAEWDGRNKLMIPTAEEEAAFDLALDDLINELA